MAYCDRFHTQRGLSVCVGLVTLMSCIKTAEPIEMPFRRPTRVGLRNHVLDGVEMPSREEAILGVVRLT